MSVYIIAQLTIADRDRYAKYEEGFMGIFDKYEGDLLSVDEDPTVMEGEWAATRSVLIKFPSKEAAMAWWDSPEYQALAEHRRAASTINSFLVNGM